MLVTNKEDLINELIDLIQHQEELWKYHPDNPERVDIQEKFSSIQKQIDLVNTKIKTE